MAGGTVVLGIDYDFFLLRTDSEGNEQWNRTYGGAGNDIANCVVSTSDGGYALAGSIDSGGLNIDAWMVKTDSVGNMQWNRTFGGSYYDEAASLVQTNDGGYAIACTMDWTYGQNANFWLIKTDASGNAQWNKTYGGPGFDKASCLVQASVEGYAIAGTTMNADWDFWLVKTDVKGNMQWNFTYNGGNGDDEAHSLVQTIDGGYAIAGAIRIHVGGDTFPDIGLVKTDLELGLAWTDSSANTVTLYRGATDPYWNFVRVSITIRPSVKLFLVVRGTDNGIYYRFFNESTSTWNAWVRLPGLTSQSPAAAICNNELRIVVLGTDGRLYFGYVDLSTSMFNGWKMIDGLTPSAPELASTGTTPP